MEVETEDKPCVHCNISFKMEKDLKTHMHDGKKPHSYNQCGFSSISAGDLKRHMLIHSREKPFNCTRCKFSCIQAGTLERHMLYHLGEKRFSCTQCNFSCTKAGNLNAHMRPKTLRRDAFHLCAM